MTADDDDRRRRLAPGYAAGVTEAMIHELVHAFYARVRRDPALGPIFNREVQDWDAHLAKLCDFWSSVTLMTGRFKGAPMAVHSQLPDIRATHFARWLHLFRQTAQETCPPEAAALFIAKAEMIGESLQLGIAARRGLLPDPRSGGSTPPQRKV
jgi:hemoglobin